MTLKKKKKLAFFVVAKEFLDTRRVMFHFEEKSAGHPPCTFNPTLHPDKETVAHRNNCQINIVFHDDDEIYLD